MVVKYNSLRLIRCCVDKSTGMKRLSKVVSAEILRCKTFHHKRLKLQTVHEWSGEEDCHAKFGPPPQNGPPWNQNSNQIGSPRNQFGCCNWPPLTVSVPPSLNYSTCMYMTV